MISQKWLNRDRTSLFTVIRSPALEDIKGAVLIVPGFSLPTSDLDYFTTQLAKKLSTSGYYVMQLDLTGQGDSSSNLEDVTLPVLRADLTCAFKYLVENVHTKVYGVSRGLVALLMAEISLQPGLEDVQKIIGINPLMMKMERIRELWDSIGDYGEKVACATLLEGADYHNLTDFNQEKMEFFQALGARIRNIHGQLIQTRLIEELMNYDSQKILQNCHKGLYILTDWTQDHGYRVVTNSEFHREVNTREAIGLERDPLWQYNLIQEIYSHLVEGGG